MKVIKVLGMLEHFAGDEVLAPLALIDKFRTISTEESVQRIQRLKKSKPKKAKTSEEDQNWLESHFIT